MITENVITRHYFNERASHWHESTQPDSEKISRVIAETGLRPGHYILDVGCGTGILFPYLFNFTNGKGNIFAIDFAKRMTKRAKQNDSRANITCAEAEYLPYQNNLFHHIIAFQIFPHIQQKNQALRECWRTLKNSGVITIFHLNCSRKLNAFHATLSEPVNRHLLLRVEQMSELLLETGFRIETKIENPELYLIRGKKVVN